MKKKTTPAFWVLLLGAFLGPAVVRVTPSEKAVSQRAELESFLRSARVVDVKKEISAGRSRPWIVTLSDGRLRHRAIFKYFDYRRPQPQPHSYRYELAAYELSKLLRVEIVPPVIERKIEGRTGSLQVFLENCVSEQDRRRKKLEPPDPAAFAKALEGVRVFESLVNDECLNFTDLMVHIEDWRLCRVDFSEAFAPTPELRDDCRITVCSRSLYEGLLALDDRSVEAALNAYLNAAEIQALMVRRSALLEKLKLLIVEQGEASVLF